MSNLKASLPKAIRSQFAPTLRRDGFSGTSRRYWRLVGGQCQVVEVQGSRYGGKFAVNMGIQPMSIPLLSGEPPEPKRMREMDCLFRRRLARQPGDQWWDYEPNQLSMDAAARDACAMYEQVGRAQLDFMAQPTSPLTTVTPEAFAEQTCDFKGFGNTGVLMAWALGHMRKAAGKNAEAQGFARFALEKIGDGPGGSGLKAKLRDLLEGS
ncbi:DUF4304 domain-containing protein [Bradyrhizobium sp. SZCCHNR2028]|uniref:DUF4304 domain-containing protein n=1 Tax=Bradyrhizobium sp. SZCCHNR2028 TaxID=3057382 RepID=UPI0028ECA478|nr:DUF4304 domain-containing protein [Bradyrhizobium sp. SZCCHNR2028]